jgi:predicted amidohydrolase
MSQLSVSIIQTALHWEDKAANLSMLEQKIIGLPPTELVVLPEMFSTGFSMKPEQLAETMEGETVQWMKRLAAARRVVLTGSVIIEDGGEFYNRLVWVLPNGQTGHYDKRHLFGFAGEHQYYGAGNRRFIASVKGWKINLQVCYDLRFPVWARQQNTPAVTVDKEEFGEPEFIPSPPAGPEYDVLVYVANWPERRAHAWRTLLQARAIENQCYVIGVNRVGEDGNGIYHSGDSMIVDPLGEVLHTRAHDEFVYTTTLQKTELQEIRTKLPFLKDGDSFLIV